MATEPVRSSDRIMQQALELFSRKGYEATSVREICEAASITKPTLYHFYGSKEGVYRAIVDGTLDGSRAAMAASVEGPGLPAERLKRVSRLHFLRAREADALAEEKAVGWFQGRMEFGPRALGGRSILGDARSPAMQSVLNLKVKYRESFRPFAPSVLRERVSEYFELDHDSPYMLLVAPVVEGRRKAMSPEQQRLFGIEKLNVPRSDIPAVTHVDYSARVQTVHEETNPRYHALLSAFEHRTGCAVIVNTSFNVRGEPIVGSPEDAFRCFMGTEIEDLAIGNCWLSKEQQNPALRQNYESSFELD